MKTLVVAPHPDDETLGCGGTLLRRKSEGSELAWVIVTTVSDILNWSEEDIEKRDKEIKKVAKLYGFTKVYQLGFPSAELDIIPRHKLIKSLSQSFNDFLPNEIFMPFHGDNHSDHTIIAESINTVIKWISTAPLSVYCYETLSETELSNSQKGTFSPNVYIDISKFLKKKIKIMSIYENQLKEHPFPRSELAIKSLAYLRGSSINANAAEAFSLFKKII